MSSQSIAEQAIAHSHHDHGSTGLSAVGRHRRPLLIAFILTLSYAAVEVMTGVLFGIQRRTLTQSSVRTAPA